MTKAKCGKTWGETKYISARHFLYRFPHGNLNISRKVDVAAKRRESTENHVFRLTILRREKLLFNADISKKAP
jgi:hypothetical protein